MNDDSLVSLLIFCLILFAYGALVGFFFRNLNPFKMILGFAVGMGGLALLLGESDTILKVSFLAGLVSNWLKINPISWLVDFVAGFKDSLQLKQAHERYQDKLRQQKAEMEADLNRQRAEAVNSLNEDIEQAHENLRREAERLKQKEEELKQREKSFSNNSRPSEPDPSTLEGAYEVLGVEPGLGLNECKQAYRKLMSIYHPDRIAQLGGSRRKLAEAEARRINQAWETLKSKG